MSPTQFSPKDFGLARRGCVAQNHTQTLSDLKHWGAAYNHAHRESYAHCATWARKRSGRLFPTASPGILARRRPKATAPCSAAAAHSTDANIGIFQLIDCNVCMLHRGLSIR